MYRFVLSRRWIGFALFVIVLAGVCVRLGMWQVHRLEHRLENNDVVTANRHAAPVPVDTIAQTPSGELDGLEWQRVEATGTYDTDAQVVVKYQSRDGTPGVEVVTPLVTTSGTALLVDRGWMETDNNTAAVSDIPDPPPGEVSVLGWWRPSSGADTGAVTPTDGQVRALSSEGIATSLDYPVYDGYADLVSQDPSGADGLDPRPEPELGQGPHFFYALQWFFFAALAVFGLFYFAYLEAHPRPPRRHGAARTSKGPERPSVDGEHDTGHVRSGG